MIDVIVIGASVRALAMSCLRAGLRPWCADLFADADLQSLAPVERLDLADYPGGFRTLLAAAPIVPILYTGGLENHPDLLADLARTRPLLGHDADCVRRGRCPFTLSAWLNDADLPALEVYRTAADIPRGLRCLRKPLRGAGGLNIAFADDRQVDGVYYQRFITGESRSALFRGAELLATTRQLVDGFHYLGTIAPIDTPAMVERIGAVIAERAGLHHLWGFDFIVDAAGVPWLVEVNPRYTAAMEVVEWARGRSFLNPERTGPAVAAVVGKRIIYARRAFTSEPMIVLPFDPWRMPDIADVPIAGTSFEVGQPVCTVFAAGPTIEVVAERLDQAHSRM